MRHRRWLLSTGSAIALSACLPALARAADPYAIPTGLPAVSAANGKVGAFIGSISNTTAVGGTGSFAFPLTDRWGGQIDGMLGTAGGGTFYGVGGHLFMRDPAKGLLGAYASYVGWGSTTTLGDGSIPFTDVTGANVGKIGVEGEAYLGRTSLEGLAAYQFGSKTGLAGRVTLGFYPTDDLRLNLGVGYLHGPGGSIGGGLEWQPEGTSVSFFAEGAVASAAGNNWSAIGGIKMYFGEQKSLIRRHREDDPENLLPEDLYRIVGEQYCPVGQTIINGFCDGNV